MAATRESGVCQCCFGYNDCLNMMASYLYAGVIENYAEMLMETFSVNVESSNSGMKADGKLICSECVPRLRDAHAFRAQVQHAQARFQEQEEHPVIIKTESRDEYDADPLGAASCLEVPSPGEIAARNLAMSACEEGEKTGPLDHANTSATDLQKLLNKTLEGKGLQSVAKTSPLENVARLRLVRIIATHILQESPERAITSATYIHWAKQIVQVFPQEKLTVYFHNKLVATDRGATHRLAGKLPDQIHNLKRKYRETGIIAKRPRSSPSTPGPSCPTTALQRHLPPVVVEQAQNEELALEQLQWLKNLSEPWHAVKHKWTNTVALRLRLYRSVPTESYFKEFPALQKPLGYHLLQEDYQYVYSKHQTGLTDNFPLIKNMLFDSAEKRSARKDPSLLHLLSLRNSSEETSNIAALLIIPTLLAVSTVRLKGSTKKVWRPSKVEVRDGFITHVSDESEMRQRLIERQLKFEELCLPIQPLVVIVGPSLTNISKYFVVINDVVYTLPNVLAAVDTCFKVTWVVNARYAFESQHVWMFLQKACYKLTTPNDKESTAANTLLGELGFAD